MPNYKSERGNAFIFILLGVMLFAALSFTIARGMRSQTTNQLSARDAELATTEIVTYAQKVARAVDRVRRKGCSENEISFENGVETGYANANAPGDNTCHIFHPDGGAISWLTPQAGVNDGSAWVITSQNLLLGVGPGADLLLILPNMDLTLCQKINDKLGISLADNPPQDTSNTDISTKFTGSFNAATFPVLGNTGAPGTSGFTSIESACFEGDGTPSDGTYHYYNLLLER